MFKTLGSTVEPGLSTKLCGMTLPSKLQKLFSKCRVVKKLLGQEVDTRSFPISTSFPNFHFFLERWKRNEKDSVNYQRRPLRTEIESGVAGSLAQARSDFWREESHSGNLRKFKSTWVVDLSALAMFASITGFILRSFQCRERNVALATNGWSWRENHALHRNP